MALSDLARWIRERFMAIWAIKNHQKIADTSALMRSAPAPTSEPSASVTASMHSLRPRRNLWIKQSAAEAKANYHPVSQDV